MSNIKNLAGSSDDITPEQAMARANYNNMVAKVAEEKLGSLSDVKATGATSAYDPDSIEEKIKRLRFAKPTSRDCSNDSNKDVNWFSKFNAAKNEDGTALVKRPVPAPPVLTRNGMTEEQEKEFQREMIPIYKGMQEELKPRVEHLQHLGKELK